MNPLKHFRPRRFFIFLRLAGFILVSFPFTALIGSDSNKSAQSSHLNFSASEIQDTLDRGCDFLLKRQNPDGSWGSARQTKGLNIFAPVPGSHRAFRLAVTALSLSALLEIKDSDKNYSKCIRKAEKYLLDKHQEEPVRWHSTMSGLIPWLAGTSPHARTSSSKQYKRRLEK